MYANSGRTPTTNLNKIHNSAFRVNQRYGGATATPAASAHVADRWLMQTTVANALTGQSGTVPTIIGSTNSPMPASIFSMTVNAAVAAPAGSDFFGVSQAIEGYNCTDTLWGALYPRPIALSFWAESTVPGQYGGAIRNAGANRSFPFSFTILQPSVWQRFTVTIPGDPQPATWLFDNRVGMYVGFILGAGGGMQGVANQWQNGNFLQPVGCVNMMATANARFDITGVQITLVGNGIPPYQLPDYETDMAHCQRYYWQDGNVIYRSACLDGNLGEVPTAFIDYPVSMRTTPSMVFTGISNLFYWNGSGQAFFVPAGGTPGFAGDSNGGAARISSISNAPGTPQAGKNGMWLCGVAMSADL